MEYRALLRDKMDKHVHFVYDVSMAFPKHEMYGVASQFRRAALSIMLNYTEGYARIQTKVQRNFFEIAYGSLKETEYLWKFCYQRRYLDQDTSEKGLLLVNEIGAMLYTEIKHRS
jgi:four helix bundle protein